MTVGNENFVGELNVAVSVTVFPTESVERILAGLRKVFPTIEFKTTSGEADSRIELHGEGEMHSDPDGGWTGCLDHLRTLVFSQRILDTFRKELLSNQRFGSGLRILLNKQALASSGRINVVDVGDFIPLGTVRLEITGNIGALPGFVNWIAPRTEKGVPIAELPL
jgi:predicted RNA binding protein with dsRBD fold (UPF0201 family)